MNENRSAKSELKADVLVVGCGPVGATLACLLGRLGLDVLIVDQSKEIFAHPRAISLDNEALRILQWAGLSDSAFDRTVIPEVVFLSPYFGEFMRVDAKGKLDGHPKLVTFFQPELESALRQEMQKHSSLKFLSECAFEHAEQNELGVHSKLRLKDGTALRVQSQFLLGADGASSKVRRLIHKEFRGKSYSEDWLIIDAKSANHPLNRVEFHCDPACPSPRMPAPAGRLRFEFMLKDAGETESKQREEIARLTEGLEIEREAVYRFHARSCSNYSSGRVFLLGDAAHLTPPFVGQGLVSGLRDAGNLAWKLSAVLKAGFSLALLESYDRERRPHALKMIRLARFAGQFIMPRNRLMAFCMHGLLKAVRHVSFVRDLLEKQDIKAKAGYFPQFPLSKHAGARSDDVMGYHFVLLLIRTKREDLDPALLEKWETFGGKTMFLDGSEPELTSLPLPRKKPHCVILRPDKCIWKEGSPKNLSQMMASVLGG